MEANDIRNRNTLYPIFLKLEEMEVLLVGAGNVGLEKLNSLLANSPKTKILIVAPMINENVRQLASQYSSCKIYERDFESSDLENKDLIILATNDRELNVRIREQAKTKGILVNVADTPDLCDFYLGSIVQKGNLKIAISTNGQSPTIAKRIKEMLNDALPGEIDELLDNMKSIRDKMSNDFADKVKRLNELTKTLTEKTDQWKS